VYIPLNTFAIVKIPLLYVNGIFIAVENQCCSGKKVDENNLGKYEKAETMCM
jgi:hypothetical protein